MSNSKRAKERRSKRQHLTEHQRDIMAQQHWGDKAPSRKQDQVDRERSWAARLGLIKQ